MHLRRPPHNTQMLRSYSRPAGQATGIKVSVGPPELHGQSQAQPHNPLPQQALAPAPAALAVLAVLALVVVVLGLACARARKHSEKLCK